MEIAGERHARPAFRLTLLPFLLFAFRLLPIARLQPDHSDIPGQQKSILETDGDLLCFFFGDESCAFADEDDEGRLRHGPRVRRSIRLRHRCDQSRADHSEKLPRDYDIIGRL